MSRRSLTSALGSIFTGLLLIGFLLPTAGCKQNPALESAESDANGYFCLSCNAKLYTDRTVFIGPKCPKCQQDQLTEVVGYVCPDDKHVTMRGRQDNRGAAPVCDTCKGPLGGMVLPREKDLKAWGATKV